MNLQISPQELAESLKGANPPRLLDVRQPDEHELVALPNSTLIPLAQILHRAGEIASWKNEELVVYCHHGVRSMMAIAALRVLGFAKLRNLTGGIDAWSASVDASAPRY